ncbi:type IV-A pilus assembly ATPase PilB [Arhodomonas sp. SL1]|uniref:type IV-A pilus assembly ATPase PilB n=1 Tax=Arhodomonas sp. SL1 TaxID=3425691 RepID=UPI003F883AAA
MATANPSGKLGGLAGRLVRDGLLSAEQAQQALAAAREVGQPFVTYLVEHRLVPALRIAAAGSAEFGLPLFDIDAMDFTNSAVALVRERLIRHHRALPLVRRGKRLYVAVSDPTNLRALDEFKFHTGLITEPVVVEDDKLASAIERALTDSGDSLADMDLDEDLENLQVSGEEEADEDVAATEVANDGPVVRFINKVLLDAINRGASDIHFEPYEREYRVRFRQDGVLQTMASPPVTLAPRLAARLKVMSRLDIAERRVPQDGRIKMNLSRRRAIDFRVSSLPTIYGEKIVLRILDPASAQMGIEQLGYAPEQKERFLDYIHKPYGMVLVTGPTGSGKTVSLYTALNILNTTDRNICTVEDPVEINVTGINQVHVNPKAGLTFAGALRSFLRQDPDVVMVGEVRDLETAEIAIKAAQTGHLVLSTLHTNDAPQTLTRLLNMGVPGYNIASSVGLIIAQRLARRLCSQCKQPQKLPREALLEAGFLEEEVDNLTVYGPKGCDQCVAGYKGRVGIYQVMPVSERMGEIIMEGGNSMQLDEQAKREGIKDLRGSGLDKVREGITSLEEINRVTVD